MPSLQQTLDQQRASQAWEDIQSVKHEPDVRKKYGSLARKVPMLVLVNGLGQTLAFLRAKGNPKNGKEYDLLYEHLSKWTMSQLAPEKDSETLLAWVMKENSAAYRRATAETLAYLAWLKRFAEAELPVEDGR